MRTDELLAVLREFHRDKLTLRQRHVAVARQVVASTTPTTPIST